MPGQPRASGLLLAALAGGIHLALDALSSQLEVTTPPYLLLDHAGEAFRGLLEIGRGTVLGTVAFAAAAVNGVIAALLAGAMAEHPRRRAILAWTLAALWVLGGGLTILVYLSPPWPVLAGSLAAGVPRAWIVAWALDRALPHRARDGATRGGPT